MERFILNGIIGDIVGSIYEFRATRTKEKNFDLFLNASKYTDDTVCSIAVIKWILKGCKDNLSNIMRETCLNDVNRGYGNMFYNWLKSSTMGNYNSYGNGSAMRVAPVGWYSNSIEECLNLAKESAIITHDHIEGVKGAQAIACCVYLAKIGNTKEKIKEFVEKQFGYNLNRTLEEIRPNYKFDATCQGSVPESIICFLESTSFEDSIRNAISLGGDTDTMAAMASAIAEAYYKDIPNYFHEECIKRLPNNYINILMEFTQLINNRKHTVENKTLVVNLYGGPGSGKSTTCAGVFERLKLNGINCEMATEYAKDKVWEESFKTLDDQIYVFGKQLHKIKRLLGKVDVIITDSPLLNSIQYDAEKNETFHKLVLDQNNRLNNINFFIIRNEHYESIGRMQTLEESKEIDTSILSILNENNIDFMKIEKDGASDKIAQIVLNHLSL